MKAKLTKMVINEPTNKQVEFMASYDVNSELDNDSQREINRILNHVFDLKLTPTSFFDNRMRDFLLLKELYTSKASKNKRRTTRNKKE